MADVLNYQGKRYVREDASSPWVEATSGPIESAARGAASAAQDIMLAPTIPLDVMGGLASALGGEEAAEGLRSGAEAIRSARRSMITERERRAALADPLSFMGGQMAGSFLPGRLGTQMVAGGLIEGGRGNTMAEQAVGAGLGVGGSALGEIGGRLIQRRISRAMQRRAGEAQATRAAEAERLQDLGIELPERAFAAEGAEGPTTRDRLRQLINPGASVREKRYSLNKLVTGTLLPDDATNAFTPRWRGKLADRVNDFYTRVREALPDVIEQTDAADQVAIEMMQIGDNVLPSNRGDVDFFTNRIVQAYEAGQLTPKWWSAARSNIAASARNAPDNVTAQALYQVRKYLDDLVMMDNPQVREMLSEANELWQHQEVLNMPGVISSERHINPTAYIRNLERMFGQMYDPGVRVPEKAKFLHEVMDASRQFPEFQTSGTGEMLTASSLSRQLNARVQLAQGTLGGTMGAAVGRGLAKTAEGVRDAATMTLDSLVDVFHDDDDESDE